MKFNPRKIKQWGLFGSLIFFGGYVVFLSTDRFFSKYFESSRLQFQEKLTSQIGHPLVIGPYKGLRSWGFAIGPSQILKGDNDPSNVSVSGLKIQFAPIASFFNWRPELILSPKQAKFYLETNDNGKYWVLGESKNNASNNLDLRIRLDNSSEIFLDSSKEPIRAKANASLGLSQKRIKGSISFLFPDQGSFH